MNTGVVAIAFFGVRGHSFEDNEYRAAHVALAIVSALKRYDLRAKCGVTVGVGFCGLVGAPNRCEYAVMGPDQCLHFLDMSRVHQTRSMLRRPLGQPRGAAHVRRIQIR